MFSECSSLTSLDLSNLDTSSVVAMNNMFYECSKLKNIYVKDSSTKSKFSSLNASVPSGCQVIVKQ